MPGLDVMVKRAGSPVEGIGAAKGSYRAGVSGLNSSIGEGNG